MNKPIFHITPESGWMNDPNGLVEYKGAYHVFYQADPEHLVNEKIGWGHKISYDLLHWEECPQALFPNECYDRDGCFTGSAVIKDDKMYLLYTGHVNQENGYIETQNLAVSEDGIHFEKYEGNPVIENPPIDTTMRFRDPKIWEQNGKYYVAIGGESKDKCGKVVYYVSNDLYNYTYCGKLADSDGSLGNMWECPNFTRVENTDVLIFSPKGLGKEFPVSFESGYMLGTMDYENKKFEHDAYRTLDYGFDFYAPQTMETEDGRRILIGWMQSWDNPMYPDTQRYSGIMTVPRELSMKGGRICQKPVRELENYRSNVISYDNVCIHEETELKGINGRSIDLQIALKGNEYGKFRIKLVADEKHYSEIIYDKDEKTLTFDRTHSGFKKDTISTRSMYVSDKKDVINLRILVDRFSVEIFVNDGEQVMTSLIYTPVDASGISFASNGNTHLDVTKYDIEVK